MRRSRRAPGAAPGIRAAGPGGERTGLGGRARWLGVALTLGLALGCAPPEPPAHLVLITVDTLRADHFGAARGGVPLTPSLARWASGGRRYADASSVATETSPGLAGILSGLLPARSGVLQNQQLLTPGIETLAERLAGSGFRTAAFVANAVVRPGLGYEQGFATYELARPAAGDVKPRAPEVLAAAAAWLAAADAERERLFLWVHLLDPHGPYLPPAEPLARFPLATFGEPRRVRLWSGYSRGYGGVPGYQQVGEPPSDDPREYLARYAGEVAAVDAALGEWMERSEVRSVLDRAVVVLTSDHGEALDGDHHYYFSHGHNFTQDQVAVPLVIRAPGLRAATIDAPVSTLDIAPTALDLLGLPADGNLDGRSLRDEGRGASLVAGSDDEGRGFLRQGELKFVAFRGDPWSRRRAMQTWTGLFRLDRDPGEASDLLAEDEARARLAEALGRLRNLEPLGGDAEAAPAVEDAELAASLRALGYIQ